MNRTNLITAAIVLAISFVAIFLRGPLSLIFSTSEANKQIASAEAAYQEAEKTQAEAEKALAVAQSDIETKEAVLAKAQENLATAKATLDQTIDDPNYLQRLRDEALGNTKFAVEVKKINQQAIQSGLALSGKVSAGKRVVITAETAGQIISTPLKAGTVVVKGDVLCQIDPGTSSAQLQQAEAAFRTAETQLNVQRRLNEQGLASDTALLNAEAGYEQARAALKATQEQVGNLEITAPFDGKLAGDTPETGTLMSPGAACATLVGLDTLKIEAYVSESDIDQVKLDAPVTAEVTGAKEPLQGKITSIDSSADALTHTYLVEVMIDENSQEILDGASAKVYIAFEGQTGHLIPQNALTLDDAGNIGVMLYQDNHATFVPVEIVRDTTIGTWISGLEGSIDLIVEGQEYAKDGRELVASYQDGNGDDVKAAEVATSEEVAQQPTAQEEVSLDEATQEGAPQ